MSVKKVLLVKRYDITSQYKTILNETKLHVHMRYWTSVRSRWLDTGQVHFCVVMDRHVKTQEKNEAIIKPS